ncbi:MAG: terpene synthase family protein [Pseudonocardiaceae bacterium]
MRRIFTSTRVGDFASHAYPFANPEHRLLADSWCLWTLLVDELFEAKLDDGTLGTTASSSQNPAIVLKAVTTKPDETDSVLATALTDLCHRTCTNTERAWTTAFNRHVATFVRSCHIEALNRLSPHVISLEEFTALRRGSFATDMFLDLVEPLTTSRLPRSREFDRIGQAIRDCAADLGGWCNDVLSYQREAKQEDMNNLVLLLSRNAGCALDAAADSAVSRIRSRSWDFHQLTAELVEQLRATQTDTTAAAHALKWAHCVEALVSGSLTFQLLSRRWAGAQTSADHQPPYRTPVANSKTGKAKS